MSKGSRQTGPVPSVQRLALTAGTLGWWLEVNDEGFEIFERLVLALSGES